MLCENGAKRINSSWETREKSSKELMLPPGLEKSTDLLQGSMKKLCFKALLFYPSKSAVKNIEQIVIIT